MVATPPPQTAGLLAPIYTAEPTPETSGPGSILAAGNAVDGVARAAIDQINAAIALLQSSGTTVTAQSIETALSFTPASAAAVSTLQDTVVALQQAGVSVTAASITAALGYPPVKPSDLPAPPPIASSAAAGLVKPSSDVLVAPDGTATISAPMVAPASGTLSSSRAILLDDGTTGSPAQVAALLKPSLAIPAAPALITSSTAGLVAPGGTGYTVGSNGQLTITGGGGASSFSRPALSAFTQYNPGTCTFTDVTGGPLIINSGTAKTTAPGVQGLYLTAAVGSQWTLTVCLALTQINIANYGAGIFCCNNASPYQALTFMGWLTGGTNAPSLQTHIWSNPTTGGSPTENFGVFYNPNKLWLRLVNDATYIYPYYSPDGYQWIFMGAQSTVSSVGPVTNVGFCLNNGNQSGVHIFETMNMLHNWELLTTVSPTAAAANASL